MIGEALSDMIVVYVERFRNANPLFRRAVDGTFSASLIANYLANVHQLVIHTPLHLRNARLAAEARADVALAKHFAGKSREEAGHDLWAARDRERLAQQTGAVATVPVAPSMAALIGHIEALIERDPALYLAYILFAEQLVVLMGREWLDLLESRCGIPKSTMSVVGNHVELDKDHVAGALDEIDALVGDPSKLPAMREALEVSMSKFDAFCIEITKSPSEQDVDTDPSHEKRIVAA